MSYKIYRIYFITTSCVFLNTKCLIYSTFSISALFARAGNGLFALNIFNDLLRSGKGESGSEFCNEFINSPHTCHKLQWSFNGHRVSCSLNSGVFLSLLLSAFLLSSACAWPTPISDTLFCPIFRKPNLSPKHNPTTNCFQQSRCRFSVFNYFLSAGRQWALLVAVSVG